MPCSSTLGGTMRLFVRLIVFVMMIFVPGILLGVTVAKASHGMPIPTAFFFSVGGFVGFWFSGKAMDSVAGKLPPDEQ